MHLNSVNVRLTVTQEPYRRAQLDIDAQVWGLGETLHFQYALFENDFEANIDRIMARATAELKHLAKLQQPRATVVEPTKLWYDDIGNKVTLDDAAEPAP